MRRTMKAKIAFSIAVTPTAAAATTVSVHRVAAHFEGDVASIVVKPAVPGIGSVATIERGTRPEIAPNVLKPTAR